MKTKLFYLSCLLLFLGTISYPLFVQLYRNSVSLISSFSDTHVTIFIFSISGLLDSTKDHDYDGIDGALPIIKLKVLMLICFNPLNITIDSEKYTWLYFDPRTTDMGGLKWADFAVCQGCRGIINA